MNIGWVCDEEIHEYLNKRCRAPGDTNINEAQGLHLEQVKGVRAVKYQRTSNSGESTNGGVSQAPWTTIGKVIINSDSEDQGCFTIMVNKDVSFHKARVAPEKQCRSNVRRKHLSGFELNYDPEMYSIKKFIFHHVSEKTLRSSADFFYVLASKPGLKKTG